jgi:outer membrane protein assembly factor BamB
MIHDDALLRALKELDQPVDPSTAFTERLNSLLRFEAQIPVLPSQTQSSKLRPIPSRTDRKPGERWMQLVGLAAAVLLFAIVGTLWSLSRGSGPERGATVVAPAMGSTPEVMDAPLMPHRSAANDGQIPGPAPFDGSYARLWKRSIPNVSFAALYGDLVYYLADSQSGGNVVVALDATTGEERWSRPIARFSTFALMRKGVVVGTARDTASSNEFRVELLDHATGNPIWVTSDIYQVAVDNPAPSVQFVIVGNTILIDNSGTAIVALNAGGGQERWRYKSSGISAAACQKCVSIALVAYGNTAYFTDIHAGHLVAVSLVNGSRLWSVALTDRLAARDGTDQPFGAIPIQMTALDQGVILSDPTGYFGLLSAVDGSTVWEWPNSPAIISAVRANASLFVAGFSSADGEKPTWQWSEIDPATGEIIRSGTKKKDQSRFSNMAYLPSANLLIGGYRTNQTSPLEGIPGIGGLFSGDKSDESVGMDPATLDVVWKSSIDGCIVNLPIAPDGKLLCTSTSSNGELSVYGPKP